MVTDSLPWIPSRSWATLAYSSTPLEGRGAGRYRAGMANRSSAHRKRAATTFNGRQSCSAVSGGEVVLSEALRRELVKLLVRRTDSEGRNETAIPELKLYRYSQPVPSANILMEPA